MAVSRAVRAQSRRKLPARPCFEEPQQGAAARPGQARLPPPGAEAPCPATRRRRYADVVVHRLLAACLGIAPLPETLRDKAAMRACADNLNVRHRNAQLAGRASVELHTLIFFKSRTVVADARVTKARCGPACLVLPGGCRRLQAAPGRLARGLGQLR
jgi:hypothetical protein